MQLSLSKAFHGRSALYISVWFLWHLSTFRCVNYMGGCIHICGMKLNVCAVYMYMYKMKVHVKCETLFRNYVRAVLNLLEIIMIIII